MTSRNRRHQKLRSLSRDRLLSTCRESGHDDTDADALYISTWRTDSLYADSEGVHDMYIDKHEPVLTEYE